MNTQEAFEQCPHLISPMHLGMADSPKFQTPRHIMRMNEELMNAWYTPNSRLSMNIPFQCAKSTMGSHYFPAWVLLLFPETRICLASYEDDFSANFGAKVKETIERFGKPLGVRLKRDSKAKNEWVIDGHGGGMVCKGRHGALTGRPADLLIMDDMIKDAEQAHSQAHLDGVWDWYTTVAYSRLGPTAPIIAIGTRWAKNDLFGRIFTESKTSGEEWKVLKFKAIATKDDPLGRQPGEALWPERVPLKRLEMIRKQRPRWFQVCWQQEPIDEEGGHFRPYQWPTYLDTGDAWSVRDGVGRKIFSKSSCTLMVTVDWATSEKKTSDYTAMGLFALTPDGRLLVLCVINKRLRLEQCVPELAALCKRTQPDFVCVESGGFQTALALACRQHREIPEPRLLKHEGKSKIQRALPAIEMGEHGRIYLPHATEDAKLLDKIAREPPPGWPHPDWLEDYCGQLATFTGQGDDHDDMVDVTAYACQQASRIVPPGENQDHWPTVLVPGPQVF